MHTCVCVYVVSFGLLCRCVYQFGWEESFMWSGMGEVVDTWLQELSQDSMWKSFLLRKFGLAAFLVAS